MILSRRGRGLIKPPAGARINWAHPLARGLGAYCYLPEGSGPGTELVSGEKATALVNLGWVGSSRGVGLTAPSDVASDEHRFASIDPLVGLASATILSWLDVIDPAFPDLGNQCLGFGRWDGGALNILNRAGTTSARCEINMSTTNSNLTVTHGMTTGFQSLAWVLTDQVLSCWVNGRQVTGTSTGVGTIVSAVGGYNLFAGSTSLATLADAVGLGAALYTRALSEEELLWYHTEPYAVLLSQSPSAKYFLPSASVEDLYGASVMPG